MRTERASRHYRQGNKPRQTPTHLRQPFCAIRIGPLDGYVFYLGNEGDKVTYPLGHGTGSGFGPGRYTVYRSTDGGLMFDSLGYTLKDSGWCRPAAAPGSQYVYVVCGNDGGSNDVFTPNNPKGTLYAYVSSNDGKTFERYVVGRYDSTDSTFSWPTVSVAPDGSIWALYVDAKQTTDCGADLFGFTTCHPVTNRLMLYHSTDHGQTWSSKDITPTSWCARECSRVPSLKSPSRTRGALSVLKTSDHTHRLCRALSSKRRVQSSAGDRRGSDPHRGRLRRRGPRFRAAPC